MSWHVRISTHTKVRNILKTKFSFLTFYTYKYTPLVRNCITCFTGCMFVLGKKVCVLLLYMFVLLYFHYFHIILPDMKFSASGRFVLKMWKDLWNSQKIRWEPNLPRVFHTMFLYFHTLAHLKLYFLESIYLYCVLWLYIVS